MRMIIVGCGRNGSGLAQTLCKMGHTVTVIDSNPDAFKALGPSFKGETVEGVGFDKDVLLKAKIDRADALAAFTSSDESNAVIARMAKEIYKVPQVVARLYDMGKAEIYKHFGVKTLSSTSWGIKRAVDLLCYSPFNTVLTIGNGDIEVIEMEVPELMSGQKVGDISLPGETRIVAVVRDNKAFLPTRSTSLIKGDTLYIAAISSSVGRLKRVFGISTGGVM